MSSNLLKRGFTQLVEEDARVINTNDLVAKRIRELAAKMQQDEGTGFISGLAADKVAFAIFSRMVSICGRIFGACAMIVASIFSINT